MRTNLLASLLVACGMLALSACKSQEPDVVVEYDAASVPCTCGDPLTALEGCAHPKCVAGENNPDNPHCVCGTLDLEE